MLQDVHGKTKLTLSEELWQKSEEIYHDSYWRALCLLLPHCGLATSDFWPKCTQRIYTNNRGWQWKDGLKSQKRPNYCSLQRKMFTIPQNMYRYISFAAQSKSHNIPRPCMAGETRFITIHETVVFYSIKEKEFKGPILLYITHCFFIHFMM